MSNRDYYKNDYIHLKNQGRDRSSCYNDLFFICPKFLELKYYKRPWIANAANTFANVLLSHKFFADSS